MSSKAIMLEYSGRDLGVIEFAEMVKFLALLGLFSSLMLPATAVPSMPVGMPPETWSPIGDVVSAAAVAGAKIILLVVAMSLWEVHRPKARLGSAVTPAVVGAMLPVLAIGWFVASRLPLPA